MGVCSRSSHLCNPYYFMYATLISGDGDDEITTVQDGRTKVTSGSIVSSLYRLKDLDGKDGAFFVFPDLSVRMEGTYKLKVGQPCAWFSHLPVYAV